MEFLNTENILQKERNLIYEPDAVAINDNEDEDIKVYQEKNEETILPNAYLFEPQKIKIKKDNSSALEISISLLAVIGFVCGIIFCGSFFSFLSETYLNEFLKGRIQNGFFANACVSFFSMGAFVIFGFSTGLSCISQPIAILLPAVKCVGSGIALASFIKAYGLLNGLLSFSAFVLPSFVMGTLITLYICRCAVKTSNRLFLYISEKNTDARPKEFYGGYLSKGLIALAGCFIGGIIDAVISFICSNFFVI